MRFLLYTERRVVVLANQKCSIKVLVLSDIMRYFIWGTILVGLAVTLGATLLADTSDPAVWGYQILGIVICGIAGIVAIVGKMGSEFRKEK